MAITANQAQGLVLALFGASAGGHLTSLSAASSVAGLAADLSTSAGLILGKNLSDNATFRDHVLSTNLKLTGEALAAAKTWMDGEFTKGTARGDILAYAVTYLEGLTDTSSVYYAAAAAYRDTVTAAVTWSQAAGATEYGVAALRAQQGNTDVVAGQSFTLTTGTDTLFGTAGNDTFTGATTTYANGDQIVDASTTDSDVLNLTVSGSATPNVLNVETVNITTAAVDGTNPQITASSLSGVTNLTITGGDVSVGGSNISGDDDIDITGLNATKVAKVTAGFSTGNISVVQATKAGVVIDGGDATGSVAVTGAATLTANTAASTVAFTALSDTTEDAKAVTANVALASSVTTAAGFTGAITINAAKAATITVSNATGGATVTGGSTSTADTTITVDNIDSSGASITTGTGYDDSVTTSLKEIAINLDGTTAATDVASVAAAGYILLDANTTDLVETVNLSGNGAAVTYVMVSSAPTTYNVTGDQSVTISQTAANLTGKTLTDSSTAGTSTVKMTTVDDADVSGLGADVILLSDDGTDAIITAKDGQTIQIGSDQTTSLEIAGKAANAAINLQTADDTLADGTTIDLSVGSFVADTFVKTLNLNATVGKFTATDVTLDVAGTDATTFNISGTKAVTLGTTDAKTVNAASLEAALSMTFTSASLTTATITSGSGNDVIVLNDNDTKITLEAGAGNNTITVTAVDAASSIGTGSGNDTITITDISSMVVVAGAGTDTVKISNNADSDAIVIGGDGTDTLTFLDTSGNDFSNNTNFAFSAFENVNIAASATGNIKINSSQFANAGAFTLIGTNGETDTLEIVGKDTTGATADTIDGSVVTLTDALLQLDGGLGADTVTGGTGNDILVGSTGSDTLNGGTGTDTVTYATIVADTGTDTTETGTQAGVIVNLSSSAIAATTILAKASLYTASTVTSVAANTAVYSYAAASSSNAATVDTLTSIENITGSAGTDYLIGSATANTITTGDGADYVNAGLGADTITLTDDSSVDTVVVDGVAASADTITGFTSNEDILDLDAVMDGITKAFIADELVGFDVGAVNIIAVGGATIAQAATAIAADTDVVATTGIIIVDDGTDTFIYKSTNLDGNGTETLIATLAGIADCTTLIAADFLFA